MVTEHAGSAVWELSFSVLVSVCYSHSEHVWTQARWLEREVEARWRWEKGRYLVSDEDTP